LRENREQLLHSGGPSSLCRHTECCHQTPLNIYRARSGDARWSGISWGCSNLAAVDQDYDGFAAYTVRAAKRGRLRPSGRTTGRVGSSGRTRNRVSMTRRGRPGRLPSKVRAWTNEDSRVRAGRGRGTMWHGPKTRVRSRCPGYHVTNLICASLVAASG
jgi:hypothetical protein